MKVRNKPIDETAIKVCPTPLGTVLLAARNSALYGLWFVDEGDLQKLQKKAETVDMPVLEETVSWLDQYFTGRIPDHLPSIELDGTPFQKEVWSILQTIPYGQTMTYGQIAEILARCRGIKRMSAQAVGQAVGANPVAILVPCHRVVGTNGKLTGYDGGLERKIALLQLEQAGRRSE